MVVRPTKKKSKNQSYFSQEFIISNHGDIVSFVTMIIVMGLLYRGTNQIASSFIFIQHNVTDEDTPQAYNPNARKSVLYSPGKCDFCVIFFYSLICIVTHAVIQEYTLDRFAKKLNLTKLRLSKFNESVHLALFFVISVSWAIYNIITDNLVPTLSSLWEDYPHNAFPFWTKLFLIAQISYWIHDMPELYFQKVKAELVPGRILQAMLYLIIITATYAGGLSRLCMVLLTLHYATDIFLHVARALHLAEHVNIASIGFTIWNVMFIPVRMVSSILAFLTLHYGLGKQTVSVIDVSTGNYNTPNLRFLLMFLFFIAQAFMVWNFITFHQKRRRDKQQTWKNGFLSNDSKRKEKKKGKREEDSGSDAIDSDQGVRKELHRRKPVKART